MAALLAGAVATLHAAPPPAARHTATALLVGTLVATHLALPGEGKGGCQLDVEVGSGAPVPVLAELSEVPGACSHPDGTRVRIRARIVSAYYRDIAPRFWLEATEVRTP